MSTRTMPLPAWLEAIEARHPDLSERQVAMKHGIVPSYWNRLKRNVQSNPSEDVLRRLGLEREVPRYRGVA